MQLIEDLRRELEHLQLYKLEAEKPGWSRSAASGLADVSSRTREVELEHEVKRLKQVQNPQSVKSSRFCKMYTNMGKAQPGRARPEEETWVPLIALIAHVIT